MQARFDITLETKENNPLEDFPRSEHWRLVTDGWQQDKGITGFRAAFYNGMQAAFNHVKKFLFQNSEKLPDGFFFENIHDALYQFEEDGKDESNLNYRARKYGYFYVTGYKSIENVGLSENGIDELIQEARDGEKRWKLIEISSNVSKSQAGTSVLSAEPIKLTREKLRKFLNPSFTHHFKFLKSLFNKDLVLRAEIIERSRVVADAEKDLDTINKKMKALDEIKDEAVKKHEKIKLIAHFIRRLNQNHLFAGGNGRTCIIVFHYLMIRYLNCMAFLKTPAHFTGFSLAELTKEIEEGIDEFNKYKITGAKKVLLKFAQLSTEQLTQELLAALSSENHIAMAQINELYLQVKYNQISLEKNRLPVLEILKKMYLEKLDAFCHQCPQANLQKFDEKSEAFERMLDSHEITKDDPKLFNSMEIAKFKKDYFKMLKEVQDASVKQVQAPKA